MKNKFFFVCISIIIAFVSLSCDSLWKVQNDVDIRFTISKDALLSARSISSVRTIDSDDVHYDDVPAVISLHFEKNDAKIIEESIILKDDVDETVIFNELEIIGERVYAKIQAIINDSIYVGKSVAQVMIVGSNNLVITELYEASDDDGILEELSAPTIIYDDDELEHGDSLNFSKGLRFEHEEENVIFEYMFSGEQIFTQLEAGEDSVSRIPDGSKTIAARAIKAGFRDSDTTTIYYEQLKTEQPTIKPESGSYEPGQLSITIEANDDAIIYYTLNGENPTQESEKYTAPFDIEIINIEIEIKAVAIQDGYEASDVVSSKYVPIGMLTSPYFNPPHNSTVVDGENLLLFADAGATIYYTAGDIEFDSDYPTGNGWVRYVAGAAAISFESNTQVTYRAIAVQAGLLNSVESTATYMQEQVEGLDILVNNVSLIDGSALDISEGFTFETSTKDVAFAYEISTSDDKKTIGTGDEAAGDKIPSKAVSITVTASKDGYVDAVETRSFKQSHYYVAQVNADNSYVGLSSRPLATVQEAVDRIIESADSNDETEYVIVVNGTVLGGSDDAGSDVVIESANALNITIQGFSNSVKGTINPQVTKRVLYVNGANLNVTLADNITISGANITDNGGGLYIAGGSVSLIGNAQISDNRATLGAGVYVESGHLTMLNGEIRENYANAIGGGAYIHSTATFSMEDGEILLNQAEVTAGGLYISGTESEISGGKITSNTAGLLGNGGGVYIENSASLTLRGEPTISGNVRGGGIINGSLDSSSATIGNLAYAYTDDDNRGEIDVSNLTGGRIGITPHDTVEDTVIIASSVNNAIRNIVVCDTSNAIYTVKNNALIIASSDTYFVSTLGDDDHAAYDGKLESSAFASVQKAVNAILTSFESKDVDEYIINVIGPIVTEGTDLGSDDGMVEIESTSAKPVNITIQGWADPTSGDETGTIESTGKRVFNIDGANLSVTLGVNLTITHGNADNGAGVYVANGAQLSIAGATIKENFATGNGGAIYASGNGTEVSMTSGLLQLNNASYGGGVYVANGSHFRFGGGTIELNTATTHGGGISTDADNGVSSVTMTGGNILANTSTNNNAGGVLVSFLDSFTMSGGTISNNMGGSNTSNNGGGVYVEANAFFNISGNPTITGNGSGGTLTNGTWSGGKVSNVFIKDNSSSASPVKLIGSLFGGSIGVSPANVASGNVVIQGSSYTITNEDLEKIYYDTTNRNDYLVLDSSMNTIEIPPKTFYVSSTGSDSNSGITTGQAYKTVQSAVDKIKKINDESLTYTIIVLGTIYGSGTNAVDIISSDTLNITIRGLSSSSLGYIDGQDARRVLNVSGTSVLVTLGSNLGIQNGKATNYSDGGGILISGGAEVILAGATIGSTTTANGNFAEKDGGGVAVTGSGSVYRMNSGNIYNNTAHSGGGIVVREGAEVYMSGGTIGGSYPNNATVSHWGGGGIYVNDSTFEMSGGTISYNTATTYGAGIFARDNASVTLSGTAKIQYNKGNHDGGGVYIGPDTEFEMNGVDVIISNNTAKWGGGLYVSSTGAVATITNGTISENTATGDAENNVDPFGAGVFINGSGKLIMTGGSITDNAMLSGNGAGVVVDDATLELSGSAIIAGNTSGNTQNNVYKRHASGKINVTSSFDDEANIGILPLSGTSIGTAIVTGSNYSLIQNDMYAFVNDRDNNEGFKVSGGNLVLSNIYEIGDVGPGGGIIFSKSGNSYKETSYYIGGYNRHEAVAAAEAYNGGGNSGWSLPSLEEMKLIYSVLKPNVLAEDTKYYFALDAEGALHVFMFTNGGSWLVPDDVDHGVRATRTFISP